ncbi:MAG: hypothetical protein GKS05_07780 [Nitrospirales bacterium]|nr:hypothetical protein [Nitrospirales bacterium]
MQTWYRHHSLGITLGILAIGLFVISPANAGKPINPLNRDFTITVDPTTLNPPTWWHVPGITPLIWTMDPVMSQAYQTTQARKITLKPGEYRFGTFTFDFAFTVTLDGVLDFSSKLSQCVTGQGTNTLTILCSHTQPYKQDPDY